MRHIPAALLEHLNLDATNLAFLWTIEKANGDFIRGTEHDRNITVTTDSPTSPVDPYLGTYYAVANVTGGDVRSSADLAVDNLNVDGAVSDTPLYDVTVADIEAGLLDKAPVTVLVTNWQNPAAGYYILRRGFLGPITRNTDTRYTTEVRSLSQVLAQTIIQTFSDRCNVVALGDSRCKFNVAAATKTGTVSTVATRKSFTVALAAGPAVLWSYTGGLITFTSGLNAGFSREVKLYTAGAVELWDTMPKTIAPADAFTLTPGCDRLAATCKDTFSNLVNFRGYGRFIPGVAALTKGPT